MASSSSDRDRPDAKDQQTNPFVAFRRFADSQMSSLMNNVFGIFESSPVRRQQAIDEYESMLRKYREMGPDHARSQSTANRETERVSSYKPNHNDYSSQTRPDYDNSSCTRDEWSMEDEELPYGDDDQYLHGGQRCLHPPRPGASNPGLGDLVPRMPTFGITYLYTSPYSPLNLEKEESFEEHSGKLRAAFADLLAYQEDQNLLPDNDVQLNAQMSPSDWLADMTGMMIFGRGKRRYGWGPFDALQFHRLMMASEMRDQALAQKYEDRPYIMDEEDASVWRRFDFCNLARRAFGMDEESESEEQVEDDDFGTELHGRNSFWKAISDEFGVDRRNEIYRQWTGKEYEPQQTPDNENDKNSTSELDLYQANLEPQVAHEEHRRAKVDKRANIDTKPSILSTLTTTEQRTLPDGSVTTKVVLKKRFSDGVEEVTENVHTQNAPTPSKSVNAESFKQQESTSQKPKDEKRSGWFWS